MYSYFSAILQVAFSLCSSRKYPYPCLPPPPTEGAFALDLPLPWNFRSRGACHTPTPNPPPPGFSVIFQLGWVPSGKKICAKDVVALYVYAKDNFFCDEMSKNVFIYVNRVSNELKDVLS